MTAMILISVVISCSNSDHSSTPSYTNCTRFTLSEGDAHFSFEYPRDYEERVTHVDPGWTMMYSARELVEEDWVIESSLLMVDVYEAGLLGNPDAEAALESEITRIATHEHYIDFEILDRSSVSIAGVKGEQCVFSYYYPEKAPSFDEGPILKLPATIIVRCVYFDHNGYIWGIRLSSTEGLAGEDEAHFEHILETFKILE